MHKENKPLWLKSANDYKIDNVNQSLWASTWRKCLSIYHNIRHDTMQKYISIIILCLTTN